MPLSQKSIASPFGHGAQAPEVIKGIDLTGKTAILTCGSSGIASKLYVRRLAQATCCSDRRDKCGCSDRARGCANSLRQPSFHLRPYSVPGRCYPPVVHGADDPLVPIEAGRDTAANITGAELIEIPGMGHDLPAALYSRIVDAIESVAKRARVGAS